MAFPIPGLYDKSESDRAFLLMEGGDNSNDNEHVIDVSSSNNASSSGLFHEHLSTSLDHQHGEDQLSTSARVSAYRSPPLSRSGSNSRNSSLIRRGNSHGHQRSPLNSGLWISVELGLTASQIIAAIVVLSLSGREHPRAPLKAWLIGYASGCVSSLPLLYWRFWYRNHASEHDSSQDHEDSFPDNDSGVPSNTRVLEVDDRPTVTGSGGTHGLAVPNSRLKALVEYFKMALDCFFAVWFVVGNVWIFGGHSSFTDAPNVYRLCIVFLTFSCIGYAMPFILCATICCCLPCIISVIGFREDLSQNRGATQESIDALPTYKFKMKKNKNNHDKESNSTVGDGGVVAAGTEKERVISEEDTVCCICLSKYMNNDELRELPCSHFFHKECIDKWLKINASCPLCKAEAGESISSTLTGATASLRQSTEL